MDKIALVSVILFLVLSGIAICSSNPDIQVLCVVLVTLVAIFVIGSILWYSLKRSN